MENNIAENMCKTREKMKVKEHKTGNEKIENKRIQYNLRYCRKKNEKQALRKQK